MSVFVKTSALTEEDKKDISEMTGKIMLWLLENRSMDYVSEQLKLTPSQVRWNVAEILYTFRKKIGRWNFFKILFIK